MADVEREITEEERAQITAFLNRKDPVSVRYVAIKDIS